jgi:hypothetical protein
MTHLAAIALAAALSLPRAAAAEGDPTTARSGILTLDFGDGTKLEATCAAGS